MKEATPLLTSLLGLAFGIWGLYCPAKKRTPFLLAVELCFSLALSQTYLLNEYPDLAFNFAVLLVIGMAYAPICSMNQEKPVKWEGRLGNLPCAYRIAVNPRLLPSSTMREKSLHGNARQSRTLTIRRSPKKRLCSVVIIWTVDQAVKWAVVTIFLSREAIADDFAHDKEKILVRLVSGQVSMREMILRSIASTYWIWHTWAQLTIYHTVLSIAFIDVLAIDRPSDWPPLFGHICEAYTLRRFWTKFWHQLFSPVASYWSRCICDRLLSRSKRSETYKVLNAFLVFTMSALNHIVVGVALQNSGLIGHLWFFWACFAAVAFEVLLTRAVPRTIAVTWRHRDGIDTGGQESKHREAGPVMRACGFFWLFAFFFFWAPVQTYVHFQEALQQG